MAINSTGININRGVPDDEIDRLIDSAAAARLLNVSRSEIYRLIGDGKLQATRVGTALRTTRRELQRYIDTWGGGGR